MANKKVQTRILIKVSDIARWPQVHTPYKNHWARLVSYGVFESAIRWTQNCSLCGTRRTDRGVKYYNHQLMILPPGLTRKQIKALRSLYS